MICQTPCGLGPEKECMKQHPWPFGVNQNLTCHLLVQGYNESIVFVSSSASPELETTVSQDVLHRKPYDPTSGGQVPPVSMCPLPGLRTLLANVGSCSATLSSYGGTSP